MPSSDVVGTWTYRSLYNDPAPIGGDPQKAIDLFFAEAEFRFQAISETEFKGVIDWGSGGLDLAGKFRPAVAGAPDVFDIVGTGRGPTAGWEYDYCGSPAHRWPAGVNQVPALVGSVIRAKPHGGAPAGVTASFVAVKKG